MKYQVLFKSELFTHSQLNSGRILENLILKNKGKKLHFIIVYPFILKLGVHAAIRDTCYLVLQWKNLRNFACPKFAKK